VPAPNNPPSVQFDQDLSDSGIREMSVAWSEHLEAVHGLGPESVLLGRPSFSLVWESEVGEVRQSGFTVTHTPKAQNPVLCAHTSVFLPYGASKSVRNGMRDRVSLTMRLVHGTLPATGPPGA
jgi:hypothetical protein